MENKYLNMPLEEVDEAVEKYDKICNDMFYQGMHDNLSWEELEKKREPFIHELRQASAAQTMLTPKEYIQYREYTDLDRECQVPIDAFISWCKSGFVSSWDGHGVYADKDKVYSWFYARPGDIYNGYIRNDFEYVCWYNK